MATMKSSPYSIRDEILKAYALYHGDENSEIGLYGGTFTAIKNWKEILKAVNSVVCEIGMKGIRISTRPDEIEDVDFLADNGVSLVEIGAQSMVQKVLDAAGRDHTVEDVRHAVERIKKKKIKVSVHLMTGLPLDSKRDDIFSAFEVAKLSPDGVRIHPTLVLKETQLEKMYLNGTYKPQSVEEAIDVVSDMVSIFKNDKIQIERTGMYQDAETIKNVIAGPYHPAFGELVISTIYEKFLKTTKATKVYGPKNLRSQIVGRKKIKNVIFETANEISIVNADGTVYFDRWLSEYVSHLKELIE
jgi:histone acetyltransferase (RNA polymerase elongator complex component)